MTTQSSTWHYFHVEFGSNFLEERDEWTSPSYPQNDEWTFKIKMFAIKVGRYVVEKNCWESVDV